MSFMDQARRAIAVGADGICALCGATYSGPVPLRCPACGVKGHLRELRHRSLAERHAHKRPIPEAEAIAHWESAYSTLLGIGRYLGEHEAADVRECARRILKLMDEDDASLIVLCRSMYAFYREAR